MRKGSVTRFTLGRLLATAGLLLALSFIVFALLFAMPGDPAQNLLGVRSVSPELLAQVRAQYHLDDPFFVQYLHWLGSVLHGDFGRSIRSDESVLSLLGSRVFLTLQLVTYAFVITVVVAVPLGVFSAGGPAAHSTAVSVRRRSSGSERRPTRWACSCCTCSASRSGSSPSTAAGTTGSTGSRT